MDISRNLPDEETHTVMEISRLFFTDRSMKSCYFHMEGEVYSKFRIGWVTSITFCFKYGETVIGNITVPDMPMLLDDKGRFKTDWLETKNPEMEINNMRAFCYVFEDVMAQRDKSGQRDVQTPVVAQLNVSKNGHVLTMSIDLSYLARMTTAVTKLLIHDDGAINITLTITNPSPVEIYFEFCSLLLKQDKHTIASLKGHHFNIVSGTFEVEFFGEIDLDASGMATLKGDVFHSCDYDDTWKQYAIKLFEAEVDLDRWIESNADDH